ncbi:hypothetical protein [Persephonella sp.]
MNEKEIYRVKSAVEMVLFTIVENDLKLKPEQVSGAVVNVIESFDWLKKIALSDMPEEEKEKKVSQYILGLIKMEMTDDKKLS